MANGQRSSSHDPSSTSHGDTSQANLSVHTFTPGSCPRRIELEITKRYVEEIPLPLNTFDRLGYIISYFRMVGLIKHVGEFRVLLFDQVVQMSERHDEVDSDTQDQALGKFTASSGKEDVERMREYKWLSKASKRRIRKKIQRWKKPIGKDEPPATDVHRLLQQSMPDPLEPLYKTQRESGTDAFSNCFGKWHHFSCGHRRRVLCNLCALALASAVSIPCETYVPEISKGKGVQTAVFGNNYHFKMSCCKCASSITKTQGFAKPRNGDYPFQMWETSQVEPVYVDKEGCVELQGTFVRGNMYGWFYVL
jgi:hypothetical protein